MKIRIEFGVDNDAFGQNHDDMQFGYHVESILRCIATDFAGETRRAVGEGTADVNYKITDGNGNTIGAIEIVGYEKPKMTLQEWWDDVVTPEMAINAVADQNPTMQVEVRAFTDSEFLFRVIKEACEKGHLDLDTLVGNEI